MARILAVGNVALDIINIVTTYPHEDDEVRAAEQQVRRGGNVGNTLSVLAQLGHRCAWAGTLADEPDGRRLLLDLQRYAIDTRAVHTVTGGKVPTSYVTLSAASGSRTIVHYRDLPEYDYHHFARIDLQGFDWVHFEGRNVEEVSYMLERVRRERPDLPCSLEVEKPRPGIESLFRWPTLLLFSRVYAGHCGYDHPERFLRSLNTANTGQRQVCAWGSHGAWARDSDGRLLMAPAQVPEQVVDTLGAGDVFNAGIIHALVHGTALDGALGVATRLAGYKCGQYGLEGLAGAQEDA